MFSIGDRQRVRDQILQLASSDARVVAAGVVGSLAHREGDRWSDLDLTFAVEAGVPVQDVLGDWTRRLADDLGAEILFDLPRGAAIYRVFLLPGCLQVDLSFKPAAVFATGGPNFELLFGEVLETAAAPPRESRELFGYAVHHALRARFCIERGRYWQAEYWISSLRDYTLSLACRIRGLLDYDGRGFDDLPPDVRDPFVEALVSSLDRDELLRALGSAIAGLLREADEVRDFAVTIEAQLHALTAEWDR